MKTILLFIGTSAVVFAGATTFASDGAEAVKRFNESNQQFLQHQKDNKEKKEKDAELARQASEKEALSTVQGKVGVSDINGKTN